jgi:hypothetical protein
LEICSVAQRAHSPSRRGTDHVYVPDILCADAGDVSAAVRYDLDQAFQFELTESFPDRCAGYSHFLADRDFAQFLMFLVFSAQDVFTDLAENPSAQ